MKISIYFAINILTTKVKLSSPNLLLHLVALAEYRSIDGVGNNLANPSWGSVGSLFLVRLFLLHFLWRLNDFCLHFTREELVLFPLVTRIKMASASPNKASLRLVSFRM